MIGILIQGIVLIAILSVLTGEDFVGNDFWVYVKAGLLTVCTSIATTLLTLGLAAILPPLAAAIIALAIAAAGLGLAIA